MNSKLKNLERTRTFHNGFALGFTREEVRQLVMSLPSNLDYSERNMGWKLRVMAIVTEGDKKEMLEMGRIWMQSVRKTVARARYLQRRGREWRHNRSIFLSARKFEKRYGARI